MRKIIYFAFLIIAFGCSKDIQKEFNTTDVKEGISVNLANAFAYASNVGESNFKSSTFSVVETNSIDIEVGMIEYLSDLYGSDIEQLYYDNKDNFTPDFSNYENLPKLSLEELNENNTEEFVEKIFATTKTSLKSTKSYKLTSSTMQNNLDDFINEIENCIQVFMVGCIENESFDKVKLKNDLLTKIQDYRENIDWNDMTAEEQNMLLTALSTVENSIGNYISFSLSFSTENIEQLALKSTQGWLKDIVKTVAKVAVMAVCLVGGTVGGVVLGGAVTAGSPYGMIVGGIAGFVGGAYATSYINDWVEEW